MVLMRIIRKLLKTEKELQLFNIALQLARRPKKLDNVRVK